jgi:hypothetical protein
LGSWSTLKTAPFVSLTDAETALAMLMTRASSDVSRTATDVQRMGGGEDSSVLRRGAGESVGTTTGVDAERDKDAGDEAKGVEVEVEGREVRVRAGLDET